MQSRPKAVVIAMWRLARAYLFYPVMIGLFLWVYLSGRHWIFGLAIILAILILDPTWRHIYRSIRRKMR